MKEMPTAAGAATGPTRRTFLKWSAVAGATAGLVACAPSNDAFYKRTKATTLVPNGTGSTDVDKTVWNACLANCQSRCPLRLQVKDGQVVRVLPDNTGGNDIDNLRNLACVRGRNQRERIYSPDRLKRPMKRAGKRGEDKWVEISWQEAFDTIASELKRVKETYGNEAIWFHYGTGSTGGNILQRGCWPRLLNCFGGYLQFYGSYSTAQITDSSKYFWGEVATSNSLEDAKNSKLQLFWGNNPLETRMSGGGELAVVQKTREDYHVRTIVIDPRYSETAQDIADAWIPIRPGTDAALVAALIWVLLDEGLQDQDFLDKYCVGFDEDHMPDGVPAGQSYRSYVEGKGPDGVEKTPEWAAAITGVPATTIIKLARELGTTKPVAITQGWGMQRSAGGENSSRAVFTLACALGQVGIAGGGTGAREGNSKLPIAMFPNYDGEEPPVTTAISCFNWVDTIDHGERMTAEHDGVRGKDKLDVGIKLMVLSASNALINQHNDIKHTEKVLSDTSKAEFILVIDHQHTPTVRWADMVLPSTTNFEDFDLVPGMSCGDMGWAIWAQKAIDPLYDCKGGYEMCTEVAKRLGIEQEFTQGRTQEEWREYLWKKSKEQIPNLPSMEEFEKTGYYRHHFDPPFIAFEDFQKDPEANPLSTDSGKIEIFSKKIYDESKTWTFDFPEDHIYPIAVQASQFEDWQAAKTSKKYPLQLIGHHFKGRTHSSYANLPKNQEAHPQQVWINPIDAKKRGISNMDMVDVFNDRGRLRIPARVTPRVIPGVVSVPQGAWYMPDKNGVDRGGNINLLTKYHPSALAKGNPANSAIVEVERTR